MSTPPRFHIREAESAAGDGEFIIAAFDSALPYLASIGSQEQWGVTPFSQRNGWADETLQQVKDADAYRLMGKGEPLRMFIVEAEVSDIAMAFALDFDDISGAVKSADERRRRHELLHSRIEAEDGKHVLSVGFAFVRENWIPKYILEQEHVTVEDIDRESCVYIEVMVADHRVSSALRKGSGAALIQGIKEYGQKNQRRCLFIDGWAGNAKKLIGFASPPSENADEISKIKRCFGSYYEQQGFQIINDFSLPRKDKVPWLGTLLRMDI